MHAAQNQFCVFFLFANMSLNSCTSFKPVHAVYGKGISRNLDQRGKKKIQVHVSAQHNRPQRDTKVHLSIDKPAETKTNEVDSQSQNIMSVIAKMFMTKTISRSSSTR